MIGGGSAAPFPRAPLLVALALGSAVAAPLYVVSGDLVGLQAAAWALCAVHVAVAAVEIWRRYAGPVRRILVDDVVLPTLLLAGVLWAWHQGAGTAALPLLSGWVSITPQQRVRC